MDALINTLRAEFAKIDRIDPASTAYDRLCAVLDQADDDALKAVHAAKIKFASQLAFNRMIRRGIAPTAPSMNVMLAPNGRNRYRAISA